VIVIVMIRLLNPIAKLAFIATARISNQSLLFRPQYSMSLLNDYISKKQMKKQSDEFKKEMEYLANKPIFTLMDYKQRVED
jgi:hypothetical protein